LIIFVIISLIVADRVNLTQVYIPEVEVQLLLHLSLEVF